MDQLNPPRLPLPLRAALDSARVHALAFSPDPSTKVGCLILDSVGILALGFNGPARGIVYTSAELRDRGWKYPRTVHAEMRALHKLSPARSHHRPEDPLVLITTHPPCSACAPHIVERGIRRVVTEHAAHNLDYRTRWKDDILLAESVLMDGGVRIEILKG